MDTQASNDSREVASVGDPSDERGASLVEYALLVALIAVVAIVAVAYFGTQTSDTFSRVSSSVEAT
jgi:pilus assembly protein Flp/PilA